ncbi:MAG: hypothetical protein IT381_19425 [Deltaproteobacteria bacterium]|nr:hypothetical protein [Deltaproteobacteria bacterium]
MKRTAREIWADRVERWQASELDAATFAEEEGCNVNTLKSWRWQLGMGRKKKQPHAIAPRPRTVDFVELVAPVEHAGAGDLPFEITLRNGTRLIVPARFDRGSLDTLLAALSGTR